VNIAIDKTTMRAKEAGQCDLSHVKNAIIIEARFPDGYSHETHKLRDCLYVDGELVLSLIVLNYEIDRKTEAAISRRASEHTPIGEQIGMLRNLCVILGNELGIEFPADFSAWNDIAIAEIEKGQLEKAAMNDA